MIQQVLQIPWRNLHIVWGMSGDKQADPILSLLPQEATYYFTRAQVPRSMDAGLLQRTAGTHGLKGEAFPSVDEAYRAATAKAGTDDMLFTGGSTFVVADLLQALGY